MSERVMTQLSEAYRKIRNTFRFALGNLSDFDPSRDALSNDQLEELDRWMLDRTAELAKKCREWYSNYEFHRVYHAIHDFCVVDLSSFYFDVLKDRLYTKAPRNKSRRSAQTAVWKIASALVRLAAPILVFTSEEIWKYFPKQKAKPDSVHMTEFPRAEEVAGLLDADAIQKLNLLLDVWRGRALKVLEDARSEKRINSSLDAKVVVNAEGAFLELLKHYAPMLREALIVSQFEVKQAAPGSIFSEQDPSWDTIEIERADGQKCERCWNYSTHVGENARYPTVCERCTEALAEVEGSMGQASSGA